MKKIILTMVVLASLISSGSVNALPNENNKKNKNNENNKEQIEVEVFYSNLSSDEMLNVELDDGTFLSDYDVTYKAPSTLSKALFNMEMMSVSTYSYSNIPNYFDYAAWITRNGVISLSLKPKSLTRVYTTHRDAGWSALADPYRGFGYSSNWTNDPTFKWQYDCHFEFAKSKDYWNLEPHRSAGSYFEVVINACNP